MVPDKFNMVDMEGIDIIINQGEEFSGLYQKLVESIAQCRYQCLYNWKSDGVNIPPTFVELVVDPDSENVLINSGVYVTPEDLIMTPVYADYSSALIALTGDPITDISLTGVIEDLTAYSNQTTGASDTNLSDAVDTLVEGYGEGQEVPIEYDELLGIYFTSTNLINTGYTWNSDTEIKLVAERGPGMHAFANVIQATNFYIGYGAANAIYYKIGSTPEKSLSVQPYSVLFTATISGLSLDYFDSGNTQESVTVSGTITTTGEVVIGGTNDRPWHGTLYLFEVSENNVKIARMIPVKRKSDNIVGLYDVIRHAFYTDSTGNGFAALTYGDMHLS